MSVDIAHDTHRQVAVLYDTTSDWAFGPVFTGPGCDEDAEDFLDWVKRHPNADHTRSHPHQAAAILGLDGTDPRDYDNAGLERMYHLWLAAPDARRGVEA